MVLELLDAAHDVTAEQAIGIAFSPQVWHAELWQERIKKAAPDHEIAKLIGGWNRRSDADSRAALAYYAFKIALGGAAARATEPARHSDRRRRPRGARSGRAAAEDGVPS